MTYYGPWTQADDEDRVGSTSTQPIGFPLAHWTHVEYSNAYASPTPIAPTGVEMTGIQVDANAGSPLDLREPSGPGAGVRMNFTLDYENPSVGNWVNVLTADWFMEPIGISPWTDGAVWWTPHESGPLPGGAIGWQWQDDMSLNGRKPATVMGAVLSAYRQGVGHDTSTTPDSIIASSYATQIYAMQGEFRSDGETPPEGPSSFNDYLTDWSPDLAAPMAAEWTGPNVDDSDGTVPVETVDLTGLLDDQGRCVIFNRMDFASFDPVTPGVVLENSSLTYGYRAVPLADGVLWTLRPPVFRWVYGGAHQAPPLRIYPRDDKLGNSPRIFPPSKTRQARNRISGYL